jgi:alkylation response protein AidB-like acyl-CoA dehydrogenase
MSPVLLLADALDGDAVDPTPSPIAAASVIGAAADARTEELDQGRQVPDDIYRRAARAGLFRQLVAPDLGGPGAAPLDWFRTGMELARHEASLGWVVTQGAVELGWIGAGGDDTWARELLADPLATSASSSAGAGRLRIDGSQATFSGSWAFNTGSPNASWIGGLALVEGATGEDGAPVIRWGWVPADRAEVVDDWDASGLRGTGSSSTRIAEQQIPTAWTFSPGDPTTNDRGPYRALVGNGFWPIATSVAATQLGNARRALDEAARLVVDKAPAPAFAPLAENAAVQRTLAAAEGRWLAAVAGVELELASLWDAARRHGEVSVSQRVRLHRANLAANALAVEVVDALSLATGTTTVARRHVLARCQRDAHALRSHITVGGQAAEWNAKVALGLVDAHYMV